MSTIMQPRVDSRTSSLEEGRSASQRGTELVDFLRAGPPEDHRRPFQPRSNGAPHSSYPLSATPPSSSAFGTPATGIIGVHLPREVFRVERDWSGGDVCQFHATFPMELEGRITPTQFQHLINDLNSHLILAHSLKAAAWENVVGVLSWGLAWLLWDGTFEKELKIIERIIEEANNDLWNEQGLNILSPRKVGLQFVSGGRMLVK